MKPRGICLKYGGFTLIELLVVVMIIAILAAIAVPNFLAAQTRSKVSRTLSDMRNVGVALEAFHTDNNRYPAPRFWDVPFLPRIIPLTTPVAYLTSLPEDVFVSSINGPFEGDIDWYMAYQIDGVYTRPYTYEYYTPSFDFEDISMISSHPSMRWALKSAGPDGIPVWFWVEPINAYDPTNGTSSYGEIILSGPGPVIDNVAH